MNAYTNKFANGPVVQVRADDVRVTDTFWSPSPIAPHDWESGPVASVERIGDDVEISWQAAWMRGYTTSQNNMVWVSARRG